MQVRLSEPCVRGSLKLAHLSFVFLQEVAGVEEKMTDAALYDVTKKELVARIGLAWKRTSSGSSFPCGVVGCSGRECDGGGNTGILEGHVVVEVAPVLGDSTLR